MATYNGQKYVAEQIESILMQSHQNFKLHINDDASTDNTLDILQKYASQHSNKIMVTQNSVNSRSAKYNFINMMIGAEDDYVMLCDQDDVWLPNKIERTLSKMEEMELKYGTETPLLVHTDLVVVGEDIGQIISPSYRQAMNSDYGRVQLRDQIIQNTLTGCTAMYNRSLAKFVNAKPDFLVMHDWWLMLVASAFGKIGSLDEQTTLYRQHGNNSIGAYDVRTVSYCVSKLRRYTEIKTALDETYLQAQSLLSMYRNRLSDDQVELLEEYCRIPSMSKTKRIQTIFRLGTLKNGILRRIANIIFV